MKIRILASLLTSMFITTASGNGVYAADGFIGLSKSNFKMAQDGIFVYCDKPDVYKKECSDVLIKGAGSIPSEETISKWRTADEYLKYKLNDSFSYIGMSVSAQGVVLYYKRTVPSTA